MYRMYHNGAIHVRLVWRVWLPAAVKRASRLLPLLPRRAAPRLHIAALPVPALCSSQAGTHAVCCRPPRLPAHPPRLPAQYNCYLRNVNKVALFRRVVDRQELKASWGWAERAALVLCAGGSRSSSKPACADLRRRHPLAFPRRSPPVLSTVAPQVLKHKADDETGEKMLSFYLYAPDAPDLQVGRGWAGG